MKRSLILAFALALAPSLRAEGPADEVKAAAKKLADAANYSWTTTSPAPEGGNRGFGGGSSEGKTTKDGATCVKITFGDRTTEGVKKGDKVAVKSDDGWKSGEELASAPRPEGGGGGGGGRGRGGAFAARMLENLKAPAVEAETLAAGAKELKKDGDAISGELTDEAVKARMTFGGGRRGGAGGGGGGGGGGPTNAKGNVKFWLKDGALAKYEVTIASSFERDGETREFKRTTITEIKDVGSTKVEVPSEAAAKLSGEEKKGDAPKTEAKAETK